MSLWEDSYAIEQIHPDEQHTALFDGYVEATKLLWDAGIRGQKMSEKLFLEALELWLGYPAYWRTMNLNIGIDWTQLPTAMIEFLGGKTFSFSGGKRYAGYVNERFRPGLSFVAECHIEFEHIHPLLDGNGRSGRLFNVYLFGRNNHKPPIIYDRKAYLKAVSGRNVALLTTVFANGCRRSSYS